MESSFTITRSSSYQQITWRREENAGFTVCRSHTRDKSQHRWISSLITISLSLSLSPSRTFGHLYKARKYLWRDARSAVWWIFFSNGRVSYAEGLYEICTWLYVNMQELKIKSFIKYITTNGNYNSKWFSSSKTWNFSKRKPLKRSRLSKKLSC